MKKITKKPKKDPDLYTIKSGILIFIFGLILLILWLSTPAGFRPGWPFQFIPVVIYSSIVIIGLIAMFLGILRKIKKTLTNQ